ncbi:endolytic transglycosylase MltG [Aureibacillus halotolerans]|uniref:Endolytic murein transglycosylase n=1 Tax=Aureibacillus halotolerans TaxID=1508390 RepID=A0A4R6U4R0_9BACI|nr:endolytic transglycosylase MltG [Aureibacillus halotolerans]TDQ38014.1 UPF0755 protein [Aureibacillus halotolerans]
MDNKKLKRTKKLRRQKEAGMVRRIVAIVASIIFIGVLTVGIGGYFYIKSSLAPIAAESDQIIDVTIPIGSSPGKIGQILSGKGIIKDAQVFKYYVKYKNEQGFQAGSYQLSPSMDVETIISQLKTGKIIQEAEFKLTIPEGQSLDQIAETISNNTSFTEEEVMATLNDEEFISSLMSKYPDLLTDDILKPEIKHPLEGYLFPATYSFYEPSPSIESIVMKMVDQMSEVVRRYTGQMPEDMSAHRLLTFASLIEEEATESTDRRKIAGVFMNRLQSDMRLQTDPTVLYALDQHKVRISLDDLEVQSPYNTYQNAGLPPGPIANMGEASLEAALNPEDTDAIYFYARPNGEVLFSETLEEHNTLKNQYRSEWEAVQEQQSAEQD